MTRRVREVLRAPLLLLDTHVWVWLIEGEVRRLRPALCKELESRAERDELVVSDLSLWEVAIKAGKGKLVLAPDADSWIRRAVRAPGIRVLAAEREALLLSARLPGSLHGDPVDRVLAATAILHGMRLVTADAALIRYAKSTSGLAVLDARTR